MGKTANELGLFFCKRHKLTVLGKHSGKVVHAQQILLHGAGICRIAQWAQDEDPRVTPFGKVMRKTRLDEIPQFWNVFKGDMSLIGPRPERPAFCDEFEKRIHGWHYRTMVRPGISGLAQVTGGYDLLPSEKVLFDLQYIKTRNIKMDLVIMLKTLGVVSTGDGAR